MKRALQKTYVVGFRMPCAVEAVAEKERLEAKVAPGKSWEVKSREPKWRRMG